MEKNIEKEYTHYIAIDFGTAGSGFACSTCINLDEVHTFCDWPRGKTKERVKEYKTPTILLISPSGEVEFGQGALDLYLYNAKSLQNVDDYCFFRNFKMVLYKDKDSYKDQEISSDMKITALNGRSFPATTVFSLAISYMKTKIIQWLDECFKIPNRKILWIVTVPAIWSHGAKQVMRQAVDKVQKDMPKDKLENETTILALEPEAAAMNYIHDVPAGQSRSNIIVDCGGGTIDVVAQEVTVNEDKEISIEDILPPDGNSYGSYEVNRKFEELLVGLCNLSVENLQEIKSKYPKEWDKILYCEFETGKVFTCPSSCFDTTITFSSKFRKYLEKKGGKKMKELVKDYIRFEVEWDEDEDELVLPYRTMHSLIRPVISRIYQVIYRVWKECSKIDEIILVGGFAISELLLQEIKSLFPTTSVTRGKEPHLAVLKGAVRYGINRKLIKSRKMRQTVGLETCVAFNSSRHKEKRRIQIDGQNYCKILLPCVEINKSVTQDEKFEQIFKPLTTGSTCSIVLYESQSRSVVYFTGEEHLVAHIVIDEVDSLPSQDKRIMVTIKFGGTEVQVSACSAVNNGIKLPVRFADANTAEESFVQSFKLDIRSF